MAFLLVLAGMAVAAVLAWQAGWQLPRLRVVDPGPDGAVASLPYVTSDVVNLRSGPATSYQILDVLDVQTPVTVTGDARQGFLPVSIEQVPSRNAPPRVG